MKRITYYNRKPEWDRVLWVWDEIINNEAELGLKVKTYIYNFAFSRHLYFTGTRLQLHRVGGPAYEQVSGEPISWWFMGRIHNPYGPAGSQAHKGETRKDTTFTDVWAVYGVGLTDLYNEVL